MSFIKKNSIFGTFRDPFFGHCGTLLIVLVRSTRANGSGWATRSSNVLILYMMHPKRRRHHCLHPEKMLSTPRYFDTLPDSSVRGARQHDCDDPKTICLACSITQTCTHKRWRMYEMAYGKPIAPQCVCLFADSVQTEYCSTFHC